MSLLFVLTVLFAAIAAQDESIVKVDFAKAPDLEEFATSLIPCVEEWLPYIERTLHTPGYQNRKTFTITFDPNYNDSSSSLFASVGLDDVIITASAEFFRNQSEPAYIIWGVASSVFNSLGGCEWWIKTGIPSWVQRYKYLDTVFLKKPLPEQSYKEGYSTAAYFLNYINDKTPNFIYEITKACREGTQQTDPLFFTKATSFTVDKLWGKMLADPEYQ